MNKTILYLVDDHKIICNGISSFLIGNDEFVLDKCFGNGQELLNELKKSQPDILLLDLKMPGLSGIQLTKIIQNEYPKIKIIVLSTAMDKKSIDEAVKEGCFGFLSKDVEEEELILALNKVKSGEHYFSQGIQQAVFNNYAEVKKEESKSENSILSEREIEVLKLFAEGLSYNEIAEKLFISKRTVETHKKNIQEKLNLTSTIDMVKYAILNGIISI